MNLYEINEITYGDMEWEYVNVPVFDNIDRPSQYTIFTDSIGWAEFQNAFEYHLIYGLDPFDINIKEKQFKLLKIL